MNTLRVGRLGEDGKAKGWKVEAVYDHPKYYEIAFSYRDITAEVDIFEQCFERYTSRRVKSILEIACGNSPHLAELLKRGYEYTGLDISEAMLAYSAEKAAALSGQTSFVQADMTDFTLGKTYDFAFIALGSLIARNTEDIFSHLRSVARALNQGGLYLLDWCIHFTPFADQEDSWSMEQDGVTITIRHAEKCVDAVAQLVEETLIMEIEEDGEVQRLQHNDLNRAIFPQEFLQIIAQIEEFEFVGWWNNWNLEEPLSDIKDGQKISRPIVLLRKT